MKSLKKLLSVVTVFVMLIGVVPVASAGRFADVTDAKQQEATDVLAAFNIVGGKGSTTEFKPEDTLTRAEMAKILDLMLGYDPAPLTQAYDYFTDVPADHWATGYIKTAVELGLVNGFGDGTFRPNDTLTYGQAITMLMRALGYEPMASAQGGYYVGYIYAAAQADVTTDITVPGAEQPCLRGLMAELAFSGLTSPLMVRSAYGDEEKYVISGTNSTTRETIAGKYLKVKEIKAVVTDTKYATAKEDEVELDITEVDSFTAGDPLIGAGKTLKDANSGAADLNGYKVTAFVKKVNNKDTVIIATKDSSYGYSAEFESSAVAKLPVGPAFEFEIYSNYEKETTKAYKFEDATPDVLVNGVAATLTKVQYQALDARITFANYDETDSKYDTVLVDAYATSIVKANNGKKLTFTTDVSNPSQAPSVNSFDYSSEDSTITLVNLSGAKVEAKDLVEDDVVTYKYFSNGDKKYLVGTVGSTTVEGTVDEVYSTAVGSTISIDGDDYAVYGMTAPSINAEGVFTLNANGKVIDFTKTAGVKGTYAVAAGAVVSKELEIYSADGSESETIKASTVTTIGGSIADGEVVAYKSSGKVEEIAADAGITSVDYDASSKEFTVGAVDVKLAETSVFLKVGSVYVEADVTDWADQTGLTAKAYDVDTTDDTVGAIVITGTPVSDEYLLAAVTKVREVKENDIEVTHVTYTDVTGNEATIKVAAAAEGITVNVSTNPVVLITNGGDTLLGVITTPTSALYDGLIVETATAGFDLKVDKNKLTATGITGEVSLSGAEVILYNQGIKGDDVKEWVTGGLITIGDDNETAGIADDITINKITIVRDGTKVLQAVILYTYTGL